MSCSEVNLANIYFYYWHVHSYLEVEGWSSVHGGIRPKNVLHIIITSTALFRLIKGKTRTWTFSFKTMLTELSPRVTAVLRLLFCFLPPGGSSVAQVTVCRHPVLSSPSPQPKLSEVLFILPLKIPADGQMPSLENWEVKLLGSQKASVLQKALNKRNILFRWNFTGTVKSLQNTS